MKLNTDVLPLKSNIEALNEYSSDASINSVTVANIKTNEQAIDFASNSEKCIPHICLNRIGKKADFFDLIAYLKNKNITEVLLLTGSPALGFKKLAINMFDAIARLREEAILVNVGSYAESFVWKPNSASHYNTQAGVLKKKQEMGATGVFTQGIIFPSSAERFIKTSRDLGVDIPINIGVTISASQPALRKLLKNKSKSILALNAIEIDWIGRFLSAYFSDIEKKIESIITKVDFGNDDGICLNGINQNLGPVAFKVKQIVSKYSQ